MAFDELPKVDRPSINSDESAIQLQLLLNRRSGLVLRPDVPDLGCDFDIEIINEAGATNWRFPLQLKSIENISISHEGKFISYPFATSRLGYLLRRQPAFGLVVLYDVSSKTLYYDYADEIYTRLMEMRGSDDWKANSTVNILIPANNVLTKEAVESLHAKFTSRFQQGALMQLSQGAKYGLPAISLEPKSGFDLNDLDDVKKALKKWGMALLQKFDLQVVYHLVSKLPSVQITSDKELCIIALITYAESGRHADSVFYTERVRRKFELTEDEKRLIDFIELKNQLRLGDLGPRQYIDRIKDLLPKVSETNSLTLRVNLLYFELALVKPLEHMPMHLGESTQKLFYDIDDSKIDELQKQYLKLWNADNMERWIGHFRNEGFAEMQIRERMGRPLPLAERLERAQTLMKVHTMFYTFLSGIDKYAKREDNMLLRAQLIKALVRFDLGFEIDQISNDTSQADGQDKKIIMRLGHASSAFNTFIENNLFHDAYQILLFEIDLLYVGRYRGWSMAEFDIDGLLKIKSGMEKEYEFDGQLAVPSLVKNMQDQKGKKNMDLATLHGLNDSQLETLAEIMIRSNKFPNAKRDNIIGQMKSYQLFYERCDNNSIVLEEVPIPDQFAYINPVVFMLRNRLTNMVSLSSSDMDGLLKSWGF